MKEIGVSRSLQQWRFLFTGIVFGCFVQIFHVDMNLNMKSCVPSIQNPLMIMVVQFGITRWS